MNVKQPIANFLKSMFRAIVFVNVLSNWCRQWNVIIDINWYHESHHKFMLLLKLQYMLTRWMRLVEAMAITHYIAGAHKCLINEFPYTCARPFERFLRWQLTNAPELVAKEEDLQKTIGKIETKELKRANEEVAHHNTPPSKLLKGEFAKGETNGLVRGYIVTFLVFYILNRKLMWNWLFMN